MEARNDASCISSLDSNADALNKEIASLLFFGGNDKTRRFLLMIDLSKGAKLSQELIYYHSLCDII